ncbi:MAG: DUF3465 domain-containing protein [Thiothrix sp.]|nr:DUF3465 domain-containing protein [Thiothrix sp.]HPQ94986.1 DUF3465 domain-containing protein [Thiolinea sp.]
MYSTKNLAILSVLLIAVLYQYLGNNGNNSSSQPTTITTNRSQSSSTTPVVPAADVERIRKAADDPQARFWTTVSGTVTRNLKDDTEGSRHQKFLVEIAPGLTLLVAHNIDLAPRVPVRPGDQVLLQGEYAWNNRGGVIHWTHHDPDGRRGGWIETGGKRYE